ncbi:MAG: FHIPEP family type III secretion protein [Clostridiales bacterium]|nr:FHIPEP family type III secretion protein [Clostridiales bacterium]
MIHKLVQTVNRHFNKDKYRHEYPLCYDELYPNDPIIFEYGYGLAEIVEEDMAERIDAIRQKIFEELGINVPPIPLYENKNLHPNEYLFRLWGIHVSENELLTEHYLAIPTENVKEEIPGIPTYEPCFLMQSLWITEAQVERAQEMGYWVVNLPSIVETHFCEILKEYLPINRNCLGRKEAGEPMLCKGIFWITDMENVENNHMIYQIPVDNMGNIDESVDRTTLNSKNQDNFNHRKTWKSLNTKETRNKAFDYYPRGRVEISRGKAVIFATPCICTEEIMKWIQEKFELTVENSIQTVIVMPDYSEHYRCHLDR